MHASTLSRTRAALGLGASLGDRRATLLLACGALAATPGVALVSASRVLATAPIGGVARAFFWNAVLCVETTLTPDALLACCKAVETRLGRRPARRWSDRVIDIDVLLYDRQVIDTAALCVPHPRLTERPFFVQALLEAWPDAPTPTFTHPWSFFLRGERLAPVVGTLPVRRR